MTKAPDTRSRQPNDDTLMLRARKGLQQAHSTLQVLINRRGTNALRRRASLAIGLASDRLEDAIDDLRKEPTQ